MSVRIFTVNDCVSTIYREKTLVLYGTLDGHLIPNNFNTVIKERWPHVIEELSNYQNPYQRRDVGNILSTKFAQKDFPSEIVTLLVKKKVKEELKLGNLLLALDNLHSWASYKSKESYASRIATVPMLTEKDKITQSELVLLLTFFLRVKADREVIIYTGTGNKAKIAGGMRGLEHASQVLRYTEPRMTRWQDNTKVPYKSIVTKAPFLPEE